MGRTRQQLGVSDDETGSWWRRSMHVCMHVCVLTAHVQQRIHSMHRRVAAALLDATGHQSAGQPTGMRAL